MYGLQIKYLSFFFGLISILSFFNIIYSYYFNLYLNLDTYYLSLFLSLILAILFYSLKISSKKTSIFQKILTVFLGYILLPLVLSIPFYLSIYNLTFINSFFESVSGFTSTGFTIFENIKNIKLTKNETVGIIIGPEGDFSAKEYESLKSKKKSIGVTLGPNILKSETAAITATSIIMDKIYNA